MRVSAVLCGLGQKLLVMGPHFDLFEICDTVLQAWFGLGAVQHIPKICSQGFYSTSV